MFTASTLQNKRQRVSSSEDVFVSIRTLDRHIKDSDYRLHSHKEGVTETEHDSSEKRHTAGQVAKQQQAQCILITFGMPSLSPIR